MIKICLLFSFLILFSSTVKAQLLINEASNRNYTQLLDEDGETNDWIELYNNSQNEINLSGWSLSDSRSELTKWSFASMVLAPGGFLWCMRRGKTVRSKLPIFNGRVP